ncbi:MAG: DsbA family protein [Alphaproteobacteria bacterium]|nr:DsbA family protein [Alphaproteobacteria bacterium]
MTARTEAESSVLGSRILAGWRSWLAAAVAGALIGAGAMWFASGAIVRSALLRNPEMIAEGLQRLQERELAKVVAANRPAFETPFAGAWAGAKDGDVVLVEFFDYACGFCRKSNADLDRLLKEDRKLKIVWRDWPVLGPDSEAAAKASLAAAAAGRFKPFHDALFAAGRPTTAAVTTAARSVGMASPAAPQNAGEELSRNYDLARAIGANGTPTFVVGDKVLRGAVGYHALKAAIVEARERG